MQRPANSAVAYLGFEGVSLIVVFSFRSIPYHPGGIKSHQHGKSHTEIQQYRIFGYAGSVRRIVGHGGGGRF